MKKKFEKIYNFLIWLKLIIFKIIYTPEKEYICKNNFQEKKEKTIINKNNCVPDKIKKDGTSTFKDKLSFYVREPPPPTPKEFARWSKIKSTKKRKKITLVISLEIDFLIF